MRYCMTEYDPDIGFTYHCLHCGYHTRNRNVIIRHCATCHTNTDSREDMHDSQ